MIKKAPWLFMLFLSACLLLLAGCADKTDSTNNQEEEETEKADQYDQLAQEKNEELELEPLELTSYSEEVGAEIAEPAYKHFAANGKVTVEGTIEKHAELKSDYVWIKIHADEEGPAGDKHEYYAPITDGEFKQDIRFFNGEGEYRVEVQVPSTDRDNYYYDTAKFTVENVNPDMNRDISYTPFGFEAGLNLEGDTSYLQEEEVFSLKGAVTELTDDDTLMLVLRKDSETWKHLIPLDGGEFSYDVPLFYGAGLHELEVLVPDEERENYYQTATTLLIDNESEQIMEPIEYSKTYMERGVTLDFPQYGGEETDGVYEVKGTIDPNAEFGPETDHIYITTKKGEDEALDVIPVEDYQFNDSFHLRFGPGIYEVTVSVPEIKEENSDYFRYFGFAKFHVDSTAPDERDLLPSRGVQSDDPQIISLAEEVTGGIAGEREKVKAVYEYVAKNIAYDVEKYETDNFNWDDSALKVLELKKGVCQDYAYLAIAMLRAADIEARFVEGKAKGSGILPGNHAWVEAKVDGNWLTMDPTWGSGYVDDDVFTAKYNEDYFDPNPDEFAKTHTRTGVAY
ncbi:transglutaminase domain-containing protein [Bacillus mesophilum]|uniref:Transglutaminase domain-containing protein n=1 Tax=Bacillus mesophilum TaxID=1071718 RepID=A0A7V7RIK1_9BACI|nr:transglutaminase-like domain-containing protein [Bacillus mesophilum]KAB2330092.1 transglutaminase domain-containing protein [Bacillus mesophilum]